MFLTRTVERAYHILAMAASVTQIPNRRLIYAVPLDSYLSATDPLQAPIFIDHCGHWQSLINLHPSSSSRHSRPPVILPQLLENYSLVG